jgi:hypothetical protein
MKNMYKAALLVALGLASVTAAQAQDSELIIGFTKASGNDVIVDLGSVSSLSYGQTWSLGSLLSAQSISTATAQWGVIGSDLGLNQIWTTAGNTSAAGVSTVNSADVSTLGLTMYSIFGNNGLSVGAGNSVTPGASTQYSWNGQTLVAANSSDWASAYATSPNVTGVASSKFYTTGDGIATTKLGVFALAADGTVSYSSGSVAVPEPTSIAAFGGAGLLLLSLRNRFRSTKA